MITCIWNRCFALANLDSEMLAKQVNVDVEQRKVNEYCTLIKSMTKGFKAREVELKLVSVTIRSPVNKVSSIRLCQTYLYIATDR